MYDIDYQQFRRRRRRERLAASIFLVTATSTLATLLVTKSPVLPAVGLIPAAVGALRFKSLDEDFDIAQAQKQAVIALKKKQLESELFPTRAGAQAAKEIIAVDYDKNDPIATFYGQRGIALKSSGVVDGLTAIQRRYALGSDVPMATIVKAGDNLKAQAGIDAAIEVGKGFVAFSQQKEQGDRRFVEFDKKIACPNPTGLCAVIGFDALTAKPLIVDLDDPNFMHSLWAGTSGGGKTFGLIAAIASLLNWYEPDHVRLLILDPKGDYSPDPKKPSLKDFADSNSPYMICPNVRDLQHGIKMLRWAVDEMNRRQEQMDNPYHLIILIDEIADYFTDPDIKKEAKQIIGLLARKARSANIHLFFCTQYPTDEFIPRGISVNLPLKVVFKLDNEDQGKIALGEEFPVHKLMGKGHGVAKVSGSGLVEFQAPYCDRKTLLGLLVGTPLAHAPHTQEPFIDVPCTDAQEDAPSIKNCPNCGSENVRTNGTTSSGTPRYRCKDCDKAWTIK